MTRAVIERIVRDHWNLQQVPKAGRKPLPSERAAEKLAADWLHSIGFDFKAAEAIQKQHRAEWETNLPKLQADAAKRAAGKIKAIDAGLSSQLESLSFANAFPANSVILDRPNAIIASDNNFLKESHIERLKSFAKIRVERDFTSIDKLSFVFVFTNPLATPLFCDFQTVLRAHGTLAVRQHGHLVGLGGRATVDVFAKLEVASLPAALTSIQLAELFLAFTEPPLWWIDHTEGPNTFFGVAPLNATGVFIRGSETVIVLVSLEVDSEFDGHMVADMNSGNFSVHCHHLLVELRQPFPRVANLPDTVLTIP
jgi:hypothetical protein